MLNNKKEYLFDSKNVYIEWKNKLKDKDCFCANDIYTLRKNVIDGDKHNYGKVDFNDKDEFLPFKMGDEYFIFCYWDKNYESKRKEILGE